MWNPVMNAYFFPHSMFNFGYLIEFVCLKSDLIDSSDNYSIWAYVIKMS